MYLCTKFKIRKKITSISGSTEPDSKNIMPLSITPKTKMPIFATVVSEIWRFIVLL